MIERGFNIRPYGPDDREFLLDLAPRLTIGMQPFRDIAACLAAVRGWIQNSIDNHGSEGMVFVAEDERGERLGFATVTHETHFTGERQAYIGELATSAAAEGRGVGRALVARCEAWARERGYTKLALETGAANTRALGFYEQLGYVAEGVKLTRLLDQESDRRFVP